MNKILKFLVTLILMSIVVNFGLMSDRAFADQEDYYLHKNSNVDTVNATVKGALPCIGDARILVFYVDFLNGEKVSNKSVDDIENMFFSEEAKNNKSLAYIDDKDSVRSYYYRSSYGKVDITGDVFEYTTKYDTSYYTDVNIVCDEIIDYYKDTINWENYDGNSDGCIDGIYVVTKTAHSFGGVSFVGTYSKQISNMQITQLCFLSQLDLDSALHETCHMFGPPDMYDGVLVNPNGLYFASFMDSQSGDLPSPTKFVLGWLDNVKFIDANNVGDFELRNYSDYGDTLIVYPNGDKTNRNWFFVEYMVKDGQNPYADGGIRMWRTQMNLDESYNVNGAADSAGGFIESPYEFLEVIHPDEIYNYCIKEGETISPYGYPSTAYSDTFILDPEIGAKYLKDLTFSGITVDFISEHDEKALVNISIEDEPKENIDVDIDYKINLPENSSRFLSHNDKYNIATISASSELNVSGEAYLENKDGGEIIPLSYEISENRKIINFYMDFSYLSEANEDIYYFKAPNIMTYYNKSINYSAQEEPIDLSQLPKPLKSSSDKYDTNFERKSTARINSFDGENGKIISILLNDNAELLWNEFDYDSNTSENFLLEVPEALGNIKFYDEFQCWKDGDCYYLYFNGIICAYKDKQLIDCLDTSSLALRFCGADNNSFFINVDKKEFFIMKNNNGNLALDRIDIFPSKTDYASINNLVDMLGYNSYKNLYYIGDDKYIACSSLGYCFINSKGIDFYENSYMSTMGHGYTSVLFENEKIYIFLGGEDLVMRVYDYDFNLLNEKVMLSGIGESTWGITSQSVKLVDNMWIVYFETVFSKKSSGVPNDVITTFNLKGDLINYYRVVNLNYNGVSAMIPLKNNLFLCVNRKSFSYIYSEDKICEHSWDNGEVFIEAGHEVTGQLIYTCKNCDICKIEPISALEHLYGDWVTDKEPTCTKEGHKFKECSCGKIISETIPATGHSMTYHEAKPSNCEKPGNLAYYICDNCENYLLDEKGTVETTAKAVVVAATGHKYGSYKTTTKAKFGKNGVQKSTCTKCKAAKTKTIVAPKTIRLSCTAYTYNGKTKKPIVKAIYDSKGNKISSMNYTVSYASGRKSVGKYKVTIKFKNSSSNYTGSKYTTFKINPKGTSISKLSKNNKSFTIKWKKQSSKMAKTRITGYQIRYSTSSKMTSPKTIAIKGYSKTSKKISKLKAKKKYYVQVRTYKTVKGTKYYSAWSKTKSVTTK